MKDNKETLEHIIPSEPPYKGDLGFKSHYIAIKDMSQPILDMFINDFKHKYKHVTDIDFNEFKYVIFMYRRDGYVHDWAFTTKNEDEIEMDYLTKKLNDFGYDYELSKDDFNMQYVVYIKDKTAFYYDDFITKEANLIISFIDKFNSDYSLFFTDGKDN